jgi:hypothetical protein
MFYTTATLSDKPFWSTCKRLKQEAKDLHLAKCRELQIPERFPTSELGNSSVTTEEHRP